MNFLPKRGVIGAALTAVALALILSFKTPDATGLAPPVRTGELRRQLERRQRGHHHGARRSRLGRGRAPGPGRGPRRRAPLAVSSPDRRSRSPSAPSRSRSRCRTAKITDVTDPPDARRPAPLAADQPVRGAAAAQRGTVGAERSGQHDLGRDLHEHGYLQSLQSALEPGLTDRLAGDVSRCWRLRSSPHAPIGCAFSSGARPASLRDRRRLGDRDAWPRWATSSQLVGTALLAHAPLGALSPVLGSA